MQQSKIITRPCQVPDTDPSFGHFIRHSLHLLDPVGNGQQVCIFGPTSRILLCSAHSATTGLIICVGVWPQINLGFRACIS